MLQWRREWCWSRFGSQIGEVDGDGAVEDVTCCGKDVVPSLASVEEFFDRHFVAVSGCSKNQIPKLFDLFASEGQEGTFVFTHGEIISPSSDQSCFCDSIVIRPRW